MKQIRTPLALLLALVLCFSLAACDESKPAPAPASTPAPRPDPASDAVPDSDLQPESGPESPSSSEPAFVPELVPVPEPVDPSRNSALDNVPLIDLPDWFQSSIWEVDGGMVDNRELNDRETQRLLDELFGGHLVLSMNPGGATMILGTEDGEFTVPCQGTWQSDGRRVAMRFDGILNYTDYVTFTACLTQVDGGPVMMLSVEENITLYLLPLSTMDVSSVLGRRKITAVPDIQDGDAWLFSGGLENGEKIGAIEAQSMVDQFEGSMFLEFPGPGWADLIYSTQYIAVPGVWQLRGNVLGFAFYPASGDPIYYTGCFSREDGTPILILIENRHNVFYLTQYPDDLFVETPVQRIWAMG